MKYSMRLILICLLCLPTLVFAETFTINSNPAETDLLQHMTKQVDDRINGVTASDLTKSIFTTRGNLTSPWVWSSTAWTKNGTAIDFTGMSPWNSRGGYTRAGTLITPKHIALANHYTLSLGDTVLFVESDNDVVTRTVVDVDQVGLTDISIVELNEEVPNTITHYPVLTLSDFEKYLNDGGQELSTYILPIVVFDQQDHAIIKSIQPISLFNNYSSLDHSPFSSGNKANFDETVIGGDSGNAGFVLIGGKPVLLLTHYTDIHGPNYSYYYDNIESLLDGYSLSTIDLSSFNAPIVLEDGSTLQVAENVNVGANVGTVGIKYNVENNTPYFSFESGNENGALSINSSTGQITVASSTLINSTNFPKNVVVKAEEGGPGGRESIGSYSINLNTYPYFNSSEYNFDINEHSPNSTVVGTVSASDVQSDTLSYSIVSGNDAGIFAINPSTGQITVASSSLLNYETNTFHALNIKVEESVTPNNLSTTVNVNISVRDINYSFSLSSYVFEINETDANDTTVGSVSATIADVINISQIYYQITAGNMDGIFAINSSTGEITILDNTNLDGNNIYNLVIGVSNGVGNSVLNSVSATIQVTKTSRPTLTFEPSLSGIVSYSVSEGGSVNMNIGLSGTYSKTIIASFSKTSGSASSNDYSLSSDTVTFLPGETSKVVTFNATSDSTSEGNETVLLNLIDDIRVSFGSHKNVLITIGNASSPSGVVIGGGGGGGGSGTGGSSAVSGGDVSLNSNINPIPVSGATTTTEISQSLLKTQYPKLMGLTMSKGSSSNTKNLQKGSKGEVVTQLQKFLIARGYIISPGATGYFGDKTKQALIKFQKDNKIKPAIGTFGPVTLEFIKNLGK